MPTQFQHLVLQPCRFLTLFSHGRQTHNICLCPSWPSILCQPLWLEECKSDTISCQNLTIILILLLGYESQSIVTITRLYRGGVWRLLRCKSGHNNEGANLQMTVGLPVCSSNVYPSLGIHLLPLFFQALLQHTLPFFPSPCNPSSYSISSTSPGSVLLGAPLWGLTGGLHLCFWSHSVASDVAPWGGYELCWPFSGALLCHAHLKTPGERPRKILTSPIFNKQLTSFCVQYVCECVCVCLCMFVWLMWIHIFFVVLCFCKCLFTSIFLQPHSLLYLITRVQHAKSVHTHT